MLAVLLAAGIPCRCNLQRCDQSFMGGGVVQETVTFSGLIIGEHQRVECEVRTTKIMLETDPPVFSDYRIVESDATDQLPDGNYELFANGQRIQFTRNSGRFVMHP